MAANIHFPFMFLCVKICGFKKHGSVCNNEDCFVILFWNYLKDQLWIFVVQTLSHVWVCLMIQPRRPSCAKGSSRAKRVEEWGTWCGTVKRTGEVYVSLPPEQIWPEMKRLFLHLWISPPSSHKLKCVRHFVSHLFDYFHFSVFKL